MGIIYFQYQISEDYVNIYSVVVINILTSLFSSALAENWESLHDGAMHYPSKGIH